MAGQRGPAKTATSFIDESLLPPPPAFVSPAMARGAASPKGSRQSTDGRQQQQQQQQQDVNPPGSGKNKKKRKKKSGASSLVVQAPTVQPAVQPPPPPRQQQRSSKVASVNGQRGVNSTGVTAATGTGADGDGIDWDRVEDFWLGLNEAERRSLMRLDKATVIQKIHEQQRSSCRCKDCSRRQYVFVDSPRMIKLIFNRAMLEEELDMMFDVYYADLQGYLASHPHKTMFPLPFSQPGWMDAAAGRPARSRVWPAAPIITTVDESTPLPAGRRITPLPPIVGPIQQQHQMDNEDGEGDEDAEGGEDFEDGVDDAGDENGDEEGEDEDEDDDDDDDFQYYEGFEENEPGYQQQQRQNGDAGNCDNDEDAHASVVPPPAPLYLPGSSAASDALISTLLGANGGAGGLGKLTNTGGAVIYAIYY